MGSKKKRHAEKLNKKTLTTQDDKKVQNKSTKKEGPKELNEKEKDLKKQKATAIINIIVFSSILLALFINSLMSKTIGLNDSSDKVASTISRNVKADSTVFDTAYEDGRAYSIYQNSSTESKELMRFGRHKYLFNRYSPVESTDLTDNKEYAVKTFDNIADYPNNLDIVVYGSTTNSKLKSVEITHNGVSTKLEIKDPSSFVSVLTVDKADNNTVDVKFLDYDGNDITSDL